MTAAEAAYQIARDYALEQMSWYAENAFVQLVYFRTAGVIAIVSSVIVAALAASLSGDASAQTGRWFGLRKSAIAVLALAAAVSSGLSGFFSWQQNWESFRKTHLQIEYILKRADLQLTEIQAGGDAQRIQAHAQSLMEDVRAVVAQETDDYYTRVKSIEQTLETEKKNID
jgi:hypothetical protein